MRFFWVHVPKWWNLVDTLSWGGSGETRAGSSPAFGTKYIYFITVSVCYWNRFLLYAIIVRSLVHHFSGAKTHLLSPLPPHPVSNDNRCPWGWKSSCGSAVIEHTQGFDRPSTATLHTYAERSSWGLRISRPAPLHTLLTRACNFLWRMAKDPF